MSTHVNPYRATTIGDLVTPSQLYWINIAAESVSVDKVEQLKLLFNCSLYELNKKAADSLLAYFARIKANNAMGHDHEHECASCSDGFNCNQSLCDATLRRYCDCCTEAALGEVHEGMNSRRTLRAAIQREAAATLSREKGSAKYDLLVAHPIRSGH
jgi:hypothetical protein